MTGRETCGCSASVTMGWEFTLSTISRFSVCSSACTHGMNIPVPELAGNCQKVVERYGGEIWVESDIGQGAMFLFTLPG